jgi:hypothetical protein
VYKFFVKNLKKQVLEAAIFVLDAMSAEIMPSARCAGKAEAGSREDSELIRVCPDRTNTAIEIKKNGGHDGS